MHTDQRHSLVPADTPATGHPSVRVVVVTCRRPVLLERALRSLLAQTHRAWVADIFNDDPTDAAVDDCVRRLADPRLRLRRPAVHRGGVANFNEAFASTDHPFAALLEDDNWWEPAFLEHMLDALAMHPTCDVAVGNERLWLEPEQPDGDWIDTGQTVRPVPISPIPQTGSADVPVRPTFGSANVPDRPSCGSADVSDRPSSGSADVPGRRSPHAVGGAELQPNLLSVERPRIALISPVDADRLADACVDSLLANSAMVFRTARCERWRTPAETPLALTEHIRQRLMPDTLLLVHAPLVNFTINRHSHRSRDPVAWGAGQAMLIASAFERLENGQARVHLARALWRRTRREPLLAAALLLTADLYPASRALASLAPWTARCKHVLRRLIRRSTAAAQQWQQDHQPLWQAICQVGPPPPEH